MDASARGDGLNMHMPPRDQRKRAPSAEPPGSTATRGRGGEGRKKAKPEWPPVEPGQEYEYVVTGIESAIAQTYTPEIMLRLKGQKVKALCENNAEGTGKLAISISGGPSGANAVNFVRSAASWWLRTNGTPDKGKGQHGTPDKGKGHVWQTAGGNLSFKCQQQTSFNMKLKSAAECKVNYPCTNRPIQCPESHCGSLVWSYSMKDHYHEKHQKEM